MEARLGSGFGCLLEEWLKGGKQRYGAWLLWCVIAEYTFKKEIIYYYDLFFCAKLRLKIIPKSSIM